MVHVEDKMLVDGAYEYENLHNVADSELNALLSDLRAAVSLAAGMLERDGTPVRIEAAGMLRNTFGAFYEKAQ